MSKYKIKDLADEISERVNDPKKSGFDKFIGLEHYTSGEARITRFGSTANLDSSAKIFHSGDILIARRNVYLKRAGIVDFDGLTSGDSIVIRAKNDTIRQILPFIFNTEQFWDFATQFADGSMSKRLSPKILMEYEINLSDDEKEREKLAKTLWAINDTLDSYKEMLKQSDEFVKAKFVEMFENEKRVRLGDYIKQIRGVSYKPSDLGNAADKKHIALLRANNINNNEINFDELQYVSDKKVQQNQIIKNGDILVCGSSGSKEHVGKAAICKFNEKYTYGAFCKLVRATKEISPIYISEYFKTDEYRSYIKQIACGANINNLRNEHIDEIMIPYPKPENQARFIKLVEQLEKLKLNLRECITKLETLYKKIVNKYLTKEEDLNE